MTAQKNNVINSVVLYKNTLNHLTAFKKYNTHSNSTLGVRDYNETFLSLSYINCYHELYSGLQLHSGLWKL